MALYILILHIPGISFRLAMQSKGMADKSLSLSAIVEAFGVDVEAYGVYISVIISKTVTILREFVTPFASYTAIFAPKEEAL